MTSRRCPRCQSIYTPPARFCVRDGSPLVDVLDNARPGPSPRPRTGERRLFPDDRAATLTGQTLDGRYRVGRKVGEGGMAFVYAATDIERGRPCAVKVLSPRLMDDAVSTERLRREAEVAQRLTHPNVCPIWSFGESPGGLRYLVMPLLDGETLSAREIRAGPLPVTLGLALLLQLCRGLAHAHGLQVLHRDLKPENVMLVPDPTRVGEVRAVVTDFGLAKQLEAGPNVRKLTSTGIVLGTPEFLSPEQIRGLPLDARSDIFALGVLAFEMFTGELPFGGDTAQDMMIARLKETPRRLRTLVPTLPEDLGVAVDKALTRDPAGRYPTMDAFAQAVAPLHPEGTPSNPPAR